MARLWWAVWLIGCAGQGQADKPASSETGACPALARTASGTCCPPGSWYDFDVDSCLEVGPTGCQEAVTEPQSPCLPRWCLLPVAAGAGPCSNNGAACQWSGQRCPSGAGDGPVGCPAGRWPHPDGGACLPAGLLSQRDAALSPDSLGNLLPALQAPPGVPSLAPLPPLGQTRVCLPTADQPARFCAQGEPGCATCEALGPPWLCPPGFVPDPSVTVAQGELVGCKPDPALCTGPAFPVWDGPTPPVHLDASAAPGGDGSSAHPLRELAAAIAAAPSGGRIHVAPGKYAAEVSIDKPLTIQGRCAAEVIFTAGVQAPSIALPGVAGGDETSSVTLASLTLLGGRPTVLVQGRRGLKMTDVAVRFSTLAGVWLNGEGPSGTLTRVLLSDTETAPDAPGHGLAMWPAATAALQDVRISRTRVAGVLAGKDNTLTLDRVLIDSTRTRQLDQKLGNGVVVESGSKATLHRVRLHANRHNGLAASGQGTEVSARLLLVSDTRSTAGGGDAGGGIESAIGARVRVEGGRLSGNRSHGVLVSGPGSAFEGVGLLVDGTLPREFDLALGAGLLAQHGATAALDGARLSANRSAGASLQHAGTQASFRRVLVDGTLPRGADDASGMGIAVQSGARLVLEHARLTGNRSAGLASDATGSMAEVAELLADGNLSEAATANWGNGVLVQRGAGLRLRHSRLSGNTHVGLGVGNTGSSVHVLGVLVDGGVPLAPGGIGGGGIFAVDGAKAEVLGSRVVGNRWMGVGVQGPTGTRTRMVGTVIEGTAPHAKFNVYGVGYMALGGADDNALISSVIRANHTAGVAFDDAAGRVSNCAIEQTRGATWYTAATLGEGPSTDGLGDGLLCRGARSVLVEDSAVRASVRAGALLIDSPDVKVLRSLFAGGLFGLVVQGPTGPTMTGNLMTGNQTNLVIDGELAVPEAPALSTGTLGL